MTYENNPKAHIRTEFGFDVTQVAKNHYTSDRYHDFIGFEISKPVLERAFQDTYGIPLSDVVSNEGLATGTFRRMIATIIPEMTRVALVARKKEIVAATPNFNARKFRYNLSRANYQREWGKGYRRPGFGTRLLALFLKSFRRLAPSRRSTSKSQPSRLKIYTSPASTTRSTIIGACSSKWERSLFLFRTRILIPEK